MRNLAQFDGGARQQAQRPVVVPRGRAPWSCPVVVPRGRAPWSCPVVVPRGYVAARNRDAMGLLGAGERLGAPLLPLVGQHRLHPTCRKAGAHVFDRVAADIEGLADGRIVPAFAKFQQDLGARAGARAAVATMHVHLQTLAVAR
jgi:hypothetical protein